LHYVAVYCSSGGFCFASSERFLLQEEMNTGIELKCAVIK